LISAGVRLQTPLGELRALFRPPCCIQGAYFYGEWRVRGRGWRSGGNGKGRGGREGKERRERGRAREKCEA